MLEWLLVVAFSAVPLTLYVPPLRNLTLFVEAMGEFFTDSSLQTARFYQRLRGDWGGEREIVVKEKKKNSDSLRVFLPRVDPCFRKQSSDEQSCGNSSDEGSAVWTAGSSP
ncbi:hypothetical protein RHMOL_Rhmol01G0137800 [Rhododendron molle]|uniref:Uncharacterized protein n=1 Tax=Rhododendron molle TaxID=49168 RepID=A0ACC0Q1H6_RHOML|nr:hypothetical protein RHMOL_Rhmol01G0137800 [Rhododendron molle]